MNASKQITFDFDNHQKDNEEVKIPEVPPRKKRGRKPKDQSTIFKKPPSKRGRRSLKENDSQVDLIDIPSDEVLFQKQYYPMHEVAAMFKINHSLIRFWENEFDILQPKKNKKGDRFFRPVDIKNLHLIFHLLRHRKYTIEGAKHFLKSSGDSAVKKFEMIQALGEIRSFLLEVKANL